MSVVSMILRCAWLVSARAENGCSMISAPLAAAPARKPRREMGWSKGDIGFPSQRRDNIPAPGGSYPPKAGHVHRKVTRSAKVAGGINIRKDVNYCRLPLG